MKEFSNILNKLAVKDWLLILNHARWLLFKQKFRLPRPVTFSLRTTFFMFALLFILPLHPLSIFIASGGALSISLILHK